MWDVACALWRFAPLWGRDAWWGGDWIGNGWTLRLKTRVDRMRLFAESYGREFFPQWNEVLDLIEDRMRSSELTVRERAKVGLPQYEKFRGGFTLTDLVWLLQHRKEIEKLLIPAIR
jgi:hypothetical protein